MNIEDQVLALKLLQSIENSLSLIAGYKKEFEERKVIALELLAHSLDKGIKK
jgi:hypothetical protein